MLDKSQDQGLADMLARRFRRRWALQIWLYALMLFVLLGAIATLLAGSPRLLFPIGAVCVAGGIVGSLVALLRSITEREHFAAMAASMKPSFGPQPAEVPAPPQPQEWLSPQPSPNALRPSIFS